MTNTALAVAPKSDVIDRFADKYRVNNGEVATILKATAFRQKSDEKPVSNEQLLALLVIADQYGLNPFTREIFAYPDKGAIVPVVSVDGWIRIINEHPQMDGVEFRYSEETREHKGKAVHNWIECSITRKDRAQPVVIREFFQEVVRNVTYSTPWDSHPNRMHRHKTLIQCARVAFGFAGIFDEDEAARIMERDVTPATETVVLMPRSKTESVREPVTVNQETGEIVGEKKQAAAQSPLTEGQLRIIRAKMANKALSDTDLVAKFGAIEDIDASRFADIQTWIAEK